MFAAAFFEELIYLMGKPPRCVVEPAAGNAPFAMQGAQLGSSVAVCDLDENAGIFERRLGSVIVSVLMLLVFGGMLYGVLPGQRGISWEGHLFGFLGGVILARTVGRRRSTVTARTPRRPKPRAR